MSHIQNQLDLMTENLRDLQESIKSVLNKEDIEKITTKTLTSVTDALEKKLTHIFDTKITELTKELRERIEYLERENKFLKDAVNKQMSDHQQQLSNLEDRLKTSEENAKEANIRSNRNEQYSRKNNIKIHEVPEQQNESLDDLTAKVCNILKQQSVDLDKQEILAIHRIPFKKGKVRPVLLKTISNDVKSRIMRQRKAMREAGFRLVDDVTQLNTGLISRLMLHSEMQSASFFNGSVYGLTKRSERIKFEVFDSIDSVISQHRGRVRRSNSGP